METPFNFTESDKPEAPSGGGGSRKLVPGRYNFTFKRVANANDYADDHGIATGKNGWKALKMFFVLKQTEGNEKEILFSESFCCDYDPMIKNDKGNSKRDALVEMGTKKYKSLCFVSGANLQDTDSLIGRDFSCELKEGESGYMELDPGAVGQNWGEAVSKDANDMETTPVVSSKEAEPESKSEFDDDIPF